MVLVVTQVNAMLSAVALAVELKKNNMGVPHVLK
tara:strand:+ start:294 stop:395 length:102 start_codon:yes stop_codon:yes gene_type:complete